MLDHFMRKKGVKKYYIYKLTNQIARQCLMFRKKKYTNKGEANICIKTGYRKA